MRSARSRRNSILGAIAWWVIVRRLRRVGVQRAPRTFLKLAAIGAALTAVAAGAAWFLRRPPTSGPGPGGS